MGIAVAAGPPGDSLLGVIRTATAGVNKTWQAYLNGSINFSSHNLNWGNGPAFAGAEFVGTTGGINQCFGCVGTLWQYAPMKGGVGWTTASGAGTFNDDGLWSVGTSGSAFIVDHS